MSSSDITYHAYQQNCSTVSNNVQNPEKQKAIRIVQYYSLHNHIKQTEQHDYDEERASTGLPLSLRRLFSLL